MAGDGAAIGGIVPPRWWRWALALGLLSVVVPLLLTLLLGVAVAGSNFYSGYGLSLPFVLGVATAATVPLMLLFAVVYWHLRGSRDRAFLVKLGAVLWGVGGGLASSVFGAEPGAIFISFPLIALVGAGASHLFILIADGTARSA